MFTVIIKCPGSALQRSDHILPLRLLSEEKQSDVYKRVYEYSHHTLKFLHKYKNLKKIGTHRVWINNDVAIKIHHNKKRFDHELKMQTILANHDISPKVITTFEYKYSDHNHFSEGEFIIVSEYVGESLDKKFIVNGNKPFICKSHGTIIGNLSRTIKNKLREVNKKMENIGYYMADFKAANFTMDSNGKIWIIDCECIYTISSYKYSMKRKGNNRFDYIQ